MSELLAMLCDDDHHNKVYDDEFEEYESDDNSVETNAFGVETFGDSEEDYPEDSGSSSK